MMNLDKIRRQLFSVTTFSYGVISFYIVMIFLGHIKSIIFNSDTLYLYALFKDVFIDKHPFSAWTLTPAPYFFPDMLLSFFINLFTQKVFYVFLMYALVQGVLTLFLISRLCFLITQKTAPVILTHITFLLTLGLVCTRSSNIPYGIIFLSGFHFGTLINGLCLLWCAIVYAKTSSRLSLVLTALIIFLATISDLFFIVQFTLPLMATLLVCRLLKFHLIKPCLRFFLVMILSTLCGFFGKLLFHTGAASNYFLAHPVSFTEMFSHVFIYYREEFRQHIFINAMSFSFCLILFFHTFKKIVAAKKDFFLSEKQKWVIFLSLFVLISIGFSWANFTINFFFKIRYLLNYFWFPVFFVWLVFGGTMSSKRLKKYLLILSLAAIAYPFFAYRPFAYRYMPPLVLCIDERIRQYNASHQQKIRYGIANYWEEKLTTVFSKENLLIAQYITTLQAHVWITSQNHYRKTYDFAIVRHDFDSDLDRAYIESINGPAVVKYDCPLHTEVLIYGKDKLKVSSEER